MTEATCSIERLNRSQPPPGYVIEPYEDNGVDLWRARCNVAYVDGRTGQAEAHAAAWAHFEAANDPPGMKTLDVRMSRWWCPYVQHTNGEYYPVDAVVRDAATQERARVYAWAWYWRRRAVADKLDAGAKVRARVRGGGSLGATFNGVRLFGDWPSVSVWPRCLTWSDEQVGEVERWLAEGANAIGRPLGEDTEPVDHLWGRWVPSRGQYDRVLLCCAGPERGAFAFTLRSAAA